MLDGADAAADLAPTIRRVSVREVEAWLRSIVKWRSSSATSQSGAYASISRSR
ncbi:hypothetical protein STENM223S_00885 [Streptomyces tendae]